MIDEKIIRYKNGIVIAKELSKRKHANPNYYYDIISKFEKILKFYQNLKVWKEFSKS